MNKNLKIYANKLHFQITRLTYNLLRTNTSTQKVLLLEKSHRITVDIFIHVYAAPNLHNIVTKKVKLPQKCRGVAYMEFKIQSTTCVRDI